MFSKKVIINLQKKDDTIHIEPLGDIHTGHVGFNEESYKSRIKDITKDDNRYTMFTVSYTHLTLPTKRIV